MAPKITNSRGVNTGLVMRFINVTADMKHAPYHRLLQLLLTLLFFGSGLIVAQTHQAVGPHIQVSVLADHQTVVPGV